MKKSLSVVLFLGAILGFVTSCQKKEDSLRDTAERIGAFAESSNPGLRDQPLVVTLERKKVDGVCACMQVCTKGGNCTGCSCSPPKCGSCATAAEVAPIDSVFEAAK